MFFLSHLIYSFSVIYGNTQSLFYELFYELILNPKLELINNAIKVEAIIDTNKLDFNNHTYLFVFGAPIKKMYYSFKTTLFDDKPPSYAKAIRHKKKCVFINYNIPTGYTYLYEIKKDETLTGFNGI